MNFLGEHFKLAFYAKVKRFLSLLINEFKKIEIQTKLVYLTNFDIMNVTYFS